MAFVFTPGAIQNRLVFGWGNVLKDGDVTASSSADGFNYQNAYDGFTNDYWKPSAGGESTLTATSTDGMPVDYFAFYGTDLSENSGTIKLQRWDGAAWVDVTDNIAPSTTEPYFVLFDETLYSTQWRVVVNSTPASVIADISFGRAARLEIGVYGGFSEPKVSRNNELLNSMSDGGVFVGRTILARGMETRFNIDFMTDGFMRAHWMPFVKHAEKLPFYAAWDVKNYPNESAFCWSPDGVISPPTHSQNGRCSVDFRVQGLIE